MAQGEVQAWEASAPAVEAAAAWTTSASALMAMLKLMVSLQARSSSPGGNYDRTY